MSQNILCEVEESDWFIEAFQGEEAVDCSSASVEQELVDFDVLSLASAEHESCIRSSCQRGVLDRDADEGVMRLSPLYHVSNVGTDEEILVVCIPAQEAETSTPTFSPKRLLLSHKNLVIEAARASFRMEGSFRTRQDHASVPATAFAVSFTSLGCALHLRQDDGGRDLDIWRVARGYPMTCDAFRFPVKRMHVSLMANGYDFPDCADMRDPLNGHEYIKTTWEGYLSKCDVGFWTRLPQQTFDVPLKPRMLHRLEDFWLPLSLKEEALCRPELEIGQFPACGMVSYPVFSGLQRKLRSSDKSDQTALLKEYRSLFAEDIEKKVEAKANEYGVPVEEIKKDAAFREFRNSLSMDCFSKIKNALSSTFGGYQDGDCVCSIGRVLAMNDTMVATSVSSLPGSWGAALFLLGLQVERMFFAVHDAPSVSQGDHSIATHTDNPSFVLAYFKYVIDDLPSSNDSYWKMKGNDLRFKLFLRWLRSHLDLVNNHKVSICGQEQDWSKRQLEWLHAANNRLVLGVCPLDVAVVCA